jgi:hypothetical protein
MASCLSRPRSHVIHLYALALLAGYEVHVKTGLDGQDTTVSFDAGRTATTSAEKPVLSVICVGMPRTGTTTLKLALEMLGTGHGYHLSVIMEKHIDHCKLWTEAAKSRTADWDHIFRGYGNASDTPVIYFYQELHQHFPNAKFILTKRDPEQWYKSVSSTLGVHMKQLKEETASGIWSSQALLQMLNAVRGDVLDAKDTAITHMREHEENIIKAIPPDQLLIFSVAQGWEPLCKFLEVPVPSVPFPRANDGEQFKVNYLQQQPTVPSSCT